MTGSVESASNSSPRHVLVIAPNWLGDGIMAMPALQVLRSQLPERSRLDVAAKPGQTALWKLHPDVDNVYTLPDIEKFDYSEAVILPNSFRSALLPFRCRIPKRRGTIDQMGRRFLINDPVDLRDLSVAHQQWENARLLLGSSVPKTLPPPRLVPTEASLTSISKLTQNASSPFLGVFPGAARGPSKQWPEERFQAVAEQWVSTTKGSVFWLGTPGDVAVCERCSTSLGANGIVLAGKTSLQDAAAAISRMDVVLANDSGGMHLATALNTPVVAVFGITDPEKTGPLSETSIVIQHSTIRNRRVPIDCPEARAALESISVKEVTEAVLAFRV